MGGSYVTLVPPNNPKGDFSLIIETMSHNNSLCIRPGVPYYTVSPQNVYNIAFFRPFFTHYYLCR